MRHGLNDGLLERENYEASTLPPSVLAGPTTIFNYIQMNQSISSQQEQFNYDNQTINPIKVDYDVRNFDYWLTLIYWPKLRKSTHFNESRLLTFLKKCILACIIRCFKAY